MRVVGVGELAGSVGQTDEVSTTVDGAAMERSFARLERTFAKRMSFLSDNRIEEAMR